MVRGAATGISAVLDPYGRILASLPLGAEGILDSRLPEPIPAPPFTHIGNRLLVIVWFTTVTLVILSWPNRRLRRSTEPVLRPESAA